MSKGSRLPAEFDVTRRARGRARTSSPPGGALVGRELDRGPGPVVARRPPARRALTATDRRLARGRALRRRRSTADLATGVLHARAEVGFRGAPEPGWRVDVPPRDARRARAPPRRARRARCRSSSTAPPLLEFVSAMHFTGSAVDATLRVPRVARVVAARRPSCTGCVVELRDRRGPRARGGGAARRLPARRDRAAASCS